MNSNSQDYLSQIYRITKREILRNSSYRNNEKKRAKRIEDFLNKVKAKAALNASQKQPGNILWSKMDEEALADLLLATNPKLFKSLLSGNSRFASNTSFGDALEKELNSFLKTFEKLLIGELKSNDKQQKSFIVGKRRTNISTYLQNLTDNEMKKEYQQAYQMAKAYWEKGQYEKQDGDEFKVIRGVQGKIDVAGFKGQLQLSSQAFSDTVRQLYQDLSQTSFSAKNYGSSKTIHLGNTNPFRVFSISAEAAGLRDNVVKRFHRMVGCFKGHSITTHGDAPGYFYRIRIIYELTGSKMKYIKQDTLGQLVSGQYAKFLVVNSPSGNIKVISTAGLIDDIMKNQSKNSKFSGWQQAINKPISISI